MPLIQFLTSLIDLDTSLLLVLNGDWGMFWDSIWWYLSRPWIWTPVYTLMMWMMFRSLGWRGALIAIVLVVGGMVLADHSANFFKCNFPKFRPTHNPEIQSMVHIVRGYTGGLYGTVSSHAATTMAIAVSSAGILKRRWWNIVMIFYVALTCMSRIYLGAHFPVDIFYGLSVGLIYGYMMRLIWRFTVRRWGEGLRIPEVQATVSEK